MFPFELTPYPEYPIPAQPPAPTSTLTVTETMTFTPTTTSTVTLTPMVFNFSGFFQPIDNLPTLNVLKAGKGVVLKFSLGGYQGMDIFVPNYPASSNVTCGSTTEDAVEQTFTFSTNSLIYDYPTDQYIYKWHTDDSWVGTCRTLVIKLSDGTYHRANFKFK
jgi:hypothetical protein